MALVIVILVLLLTVAFFYLKCSIMQSFMTLGSAVLATIVAFSYYEGIAELLISRGQALNWALMGSFTLLFIVTFAIVRAISNFLIPSAIELGNVVKLSASLPCGFLTGLIISGNLLVILGLLPLHGKIFYSRFDPDAPIILSSPKAPALSTDGFVAGLYSWVSSGSMSSGQSFGVLHADYLTQIHLNKLKTKDKVLTVSSRKALILPRGKAVKPVRLEMVDDKEVMIVRAGIRAGKIEDGGANNAYGKTAFFPAQIRMIVKDEPSSVGDFTGFAEALYPIGFFKNGVLEKEISLGDSIPENFGTVKNKTLWMDVAFEVPRDKTPFLLEFKQNAVVDLTPYEVVKNTPEIERALDNEGQKEKTP